MTFSALFTKRKVVCVVPVALMVALAQNIGREIEQYGGLRYTNIMLYLCFLLQAIIYFIVISCAFTYLEKRNVRGDSLLFRQGTRYIRPLCQIGMLFCWIPVLLAAFPGFFCYDAGQQLDQVIQKAYTVHHPLLHTLILGKLLEVCENVFGSYNSGVFIYVSLQAMILTGIFTEVLLEIGKSTRNKWLTIFGFLYYSFFPTIIMFGLCTTKDTIFSAMLLLHILYLMRLLKSDNQKGQLVVMTIVSAVLTMLFRNNGVYALLLFYVVMIIISRKLRNTFIKILLFSTFGFFILSGALEFILQAKQTDMREMFSVPAQQIARLYNEKGSEVFASEDVELLYALIPKEDLLRYNEKLADPVKANLHIGFNSTLKDFSRLWLKYGIKEPGIYADALFYQTYQAYYPQAILDGYCGENAKPRYKTSQTCYFSCDVEAPAYADSKFPGLLNIYYKLSRQITFQRIPVVSFFFSIGGMLYCAVIALSYTIYRKKMAQAAGIGMMLCVCMTCLLGPIVLIRYYLILFFAFPLVISVFFPVLEETAFKNTRGK